jgi:hypothetical protein
MDEETDQQQNDDNNNDSSACHLPPFLKIRVDHNKRLPAFDRETHPIHRRKARPVPIPRD